MNSLLGSDLMINYMSQRLKEKRRFSRRQSATKNGLYVANFTQGFKAIIKAREKKLKCNL